jgi:hypothetical protein
MTLGLLEVPQKNTRTTQGPVALPILYHDASVLQAFFVVDGAKATALLRDTGLKPVLTAGKALAGLVFFEYRDTSIGSYNEVGLALAVHRDEGAGQPAVARDLLVSSENRKIGFYVVDLPVTTEAACAAGKEIWGFPKFVTKLPISFGRGRFEGTVMAPRSKSPICMLKGTYPLGPRLPAIDLVLFSNHKRKILKTVVTTQASLTTTYGRGLQLQIGNAKHRMTDNLRALGLEGARPFALQVTGNFQSILPAGVPVG